MLTGARWVVAEIMDGPEVDAADHALALKGLRRINEASKSSRRIAEPIIAMARRRNLKKLSMLDIACGGGDVPVGVVLAVREAGIEIDLTLLDRSQTALEIAAETAKRAGIVGRCVTGELPGNWAQSDFDVVTCSLFLHHLPSPGAVVTLLGQMKNISRRLVVISDLRRCFMGLMVAWAGSRILSRSAIVHYDAPASVRAAWTLAEMRQMAADANVPEARIEQSWPWRMLLTWEAKEGA
jgi:2-polyprenyl-3-methyl-5-hydroxy-6-metoxy-1,4-benzoquinol methylase